MNNLNHSRKLLRRTKMVPLLITSCFIIIGLIYFLWWHAKIQGYKVIYNHGSLYSKNDYKNNVSNSVEFIKTLRMEYAKLIDREVHRKFKREFKLFKQDSIGAKLVISSFGDSLIYIYPNTINQIIVDCIDFPVQTAFAHGFIDLNTPNKEVNLRQVELKIPVPEAIEKYKSEPGHIIIADGNWIIFSGGGNIIFENINKLFTFEGKSIIGIVSNIGFKHSDPDYIQKYGSMGYHQYKNQGLLMISNQNCFDNSLQIAMDLGKEMAEIEIKDLLTKSDFFKLSLDEKRLRPKAEDIIRKTTRSEKDRSFLYPLWEFKKEVGELKTEANQIGIDSSYVDELLKDPSLKSTDGFLFVYYPNARGLMLQWFIMNLIFLNILSVLTLKYGNYSPLILAMRNISLIGTNISILSLITSANLWVFYKKPESVTIMYWILPGILYLLCIAYCAAIVIYMRHNPDVHSFY